MVMVVPIEVKLFLGQSSVDRGEQPLAKRLFVSARKKATFFARLSPIWDLYVL
jgi:hypothetical protein